MTMRIAALTTCHNRCDLTEQCLDSLKQAVLNFPGIDFTCFVVDDGSSDGTSEMIKKKHPDIILISGNGELFWNRGMIRAWNEALKEENNFDAFLLFNDDTLFYKQSIKELISTFVNEKKQYDVPLAIAGSVLDPVSKTTSYGGLIKGNNKFNPLRFSLIKPKSEIVECDTLNMNCALIDIKSVETIGVLDHFFHHSYGDLDYGLRLKKAGGKILVTANHVGECERNQIQNTWLDSSKGRIYRLKKMLSIKGMPLKERRHYYKRHGGFLWPIYWVAPYLAMLLLNIKVQGKRKLC